MAAKAPQGRIPRKNVGQDQASLTALFFLDLPFVLTKWAEVVALLASIGLVKLDLGSLVGLSEVEAAVRQLARLLQH